MLKRCLLTQLGKVRTRTLHLASFSIDPPAPTSLTLHFHRQLVLQPHLPEGGRDTAAAAGEPARHVPGAAFRAHDQHVLPVCAGNCESRAAVRFVPWDVVWVHIAISVIYRVLPAPAGVAYDADDLLPL